MSSNKASSSNMSNTVDPDSVLMREDAAFGVIQSPRMTPEQDMNAAKGIAGSTIKFLAEKETRTQFRGENTDWTYLTEDLLKIPVECWGSVCKTLAKLGKEDITELRQAGKLDVGIKWKGDGGSNQISVYRWVQIDPNTSREDMRSFSKVWTPKRFAACTLPFQYTAALTYKQYLSEGRFVADDLEQYMSSHAKMNGFYVPEDPEVCIAGLTCVIGCELMSTIFDKSGLGISLEELHGMMEWGYASAVKSQVRTSNFPQPISAARLIATMFNSYVNSGFYSDATNIFKSKQFYLNMKMKYARLVGGTGSVFRSLYAETVKGAIDEIAGKATADGLADLRANRANRMSKPVPSGRTMMKAPAVQFSQPQVQQMQPQGGFQQQQGTYQSPYMPGFGQGMGMQYQVPQPSQYSSGYQQMPYYNPLMVPQTMNMSGVSRGQSSM